MMPMLFQLLKQQWKKKLRSPYWTQSIVQSIFLGFFALYFILVFLGLGLMADKILEEVFPEKDAFVTFSGLLLYYFFMDIFVRFFLQKFPSLGIKPYLTLPISKKQIAHFLLLRSIPSFFNILPLFFIIPFFFKTVLPNQPAAISSAWLALAILLVFAGNFVSYYIDKAFGVKPVLAAVLMSVLVGLMYLDFSGYIPLGDYLESIAFFMIANPLTLLAILGLVLLSYYGIYRLFNDHVYLEEQGEVESSISEARLWDMNLFDRFGKPGEIMDLETRLIWRNKRSRTILYVSLLFILYPLIFAGDENFDKPWFMLIMSLILTGAFTLNYGQLMLSWNSPHFDFILTRSIRIEDIFKGKYYLLAISNILLFVLSLPFGFIDARFWMTNLAMLLFNTGVTIFLYMVVANYSSKPIDTEKGGVFNMEGFGAAHYLIILPIIIIPVALYLVLSSFLGSAVGMAAIGLIGLLGIIFREAILKAIVQNFKSRKYKIAAAFRKK
ncbi:MAG: DUF5687 family protein [Bacteroidota bacterium]